MTLGLSKSSDSSVIHCNQYTRDKKRKFDELMTENKVSINCESSKQSKRSYDIERFSGNVSLESPAKKSRISNIMSGNRDLNPIKEQEWKIRSVFNSLIAKFGYKKDVTSVSNNEQNSNSLTVTRNKNALALRDSIEICDNNSKLAFNIENDCAKKISNNAIDEQNSALVPQPNFSTNVVKSRFDEFSRHKHNKHEKHDKHHLKPYLNIMSYYPSSRFSSNSLFKRYKNYYPYRQEEKEKYRMLINSHLSPNVSSTNVIVSNKFQTQPIIDLTSSTNTSRRSSLQKDGLISSTKIAYHLTNSGVHTQKLEDNCKNSLIERIPSKGIVTQDPPTYNKQSSITKHQFTPFTPFTPFNQRLRKYQPLCTSTPHNANLCANVNNTSEVIPKLPESCDAFKNLMKEKKDFLDQSFVSEMRNSLKSSHDSNNRKILDGERKLKECKNKRQKDHQNLESYIKAPYVRSELIPYIPYFPLVKEEEEDDEDQQQEEIDDDQHILSKDLPPLTPEMEQMIDDALRPTPPGQVLSEAFSITVKRKDMETLSGLNWLNDEIINYYMSLIVERSKLDNFSSAYAFNTFFYPKLREGGHTVLKRWTRKVDVFSFNLIFIPVHLGMHWCLAVIDFTRKKIQYYDSMGGTNNECLNALKQYLHDESVDKKKQEYDMSDWTLEVVKDIPQQENGSDCGMFTCKYAEYISRNSKLNFSQAHMPYFRRRMVYEILSKRLL